MAITLKELAAELGLSKTTASRALAGYSDVAAATAERVRAAARRHGYRPNPVAQRLKSGRMEAIGLVLPTGPGAFADPFMLELMTAVGVGLAARGLDLLVSAAAPGDDELAAMRRMIEGKRVDGMLVVRTRRRDARVGLLLETGTPFVCHGRTDERRPYAYVDVDGERAMAEATARLIALGHRRVAMINTPDELSFSAHRRAGYVAAMSAAGLAPAPAFAAAQSEEGGRRAARATLARGPDERPTALACATDLQAAGALRAVRELGLSGGRDVSVVGFDDLPFSGYTEPPLATMRQPIAAIGHGLAEMIAELRDGARPGDLHRMFDAEFIARASAGPPPP